ncbi:MAG TPA: hypothetical protein VLI90_18885 [Tepidisphaeraceae bacterium]|nr:hypothetical protein [Tepidisphaeraceae bacterium]
MKIVVGGYIVGFPLGGMTWHHLNYLLGLHELGHEVYFLEDSGRYSIPYNPTTWSCSVDSTYGRAYLERTFQKYGLPLRYCYYSEFEDQHYGMSREELADVLKRADLLIAVSGVTPLRDERPRPRRTAVIDTDPVFTQLRMRHDANFLNYYRQFDAVATFGRLIGTDACPLPTHGFDWIPTNQPIALRHWPVMPVTSRRFTTVGKWEHTSDRNLEFAGRTFHSSKGVEWTKVIDLPRRTRWEMAIGMAAITPAAKEQFTQSGWQLLDAEAATISCEAFQQFIQNSAGEFTVAKEIYAGLPSGWFSDRSAAYLTSGRPVVTQASGFDQWLPVGEGLFSFETIDQAAWALEQIERDYAMQSAAARRMAERNFDSRLVLSKLLDRAL